MNSIRQIRELNKRELENGVSPDASWHTDYRDTAYIYIGGLPFELSEGDILAIFSQYGEPTYINLVRDKETGKSRGFAFLKYEDQRSTDLAVDNLGGAVIMSRTLKVDHTRYKKKDGEEETGMDLTEPVAMIQEEGEPGRRKRRRTSESESEEEKPMIKEERELAKLIQEHDEEDPMKQFLIQEKREEIEAARAWARRDGNKRDKERKHKHHHRSAREGEGETEKSRARHSHRRRDDRGREIDKTRHREGHDRSQREERERSRSRDRNYRDNREIVSDRHETQGTDFRQETRHRSRRDG